MPGQSRLSSPHSSFTDTFGAEKGGVRPASSQTSQVTTWLSTRLTVGPQCPHSSSLAALRAPSLGDKAAAHHTCPRGQDTWQGGLTSGLWPSMTDLVSYQGCRTPSLLRQIPAPLKIQSLRTRGHFLPVAPTLILNQSLPDPTASPKHGPSLWPLI